MHDVSNAINSLDPGKGTIDKLICKDQTTKCKKVSDDSSDISTNFQLSRVFTETAYTSKETENFPKHNADIVAKDISTNLNRDQHGVVSSAFAKAHEGAEIAIAVDIHQRYISSK